MNRALLGAVLALAGCVAGRDEPAKPPSVHPLTEKHKAMEGMRLAAARPVGPGKWAAMVSPLSGFVTLAPTQRVPPEALWQHTTCSPTYADEIESLDVEFISRSVLPGSTVELLDVHGVHRVEITGLSDDCTEYPATLVMTFDLPGEHGQLGLVALEGYFASDARLRREGVDEEIDAIANPARTGIALWFQGTMDHSLVVGQVEPIAVDMPDAGVVALLLEHQSYTEFERVDDSLHHSIGAFLVETSGRPLPFGPELEPPTIGRYDAVVGDIDGDGNDEVLLERVEIPDIVEAPTIYRTTWDFLFYDGREIVEWELGVVSN